MILDCKLNFNEHLKSVSVKVNKTIGLICKFRLHLSRNCLLTIDKAFIRSRLDYGDKIYDNANNESFHKHESIQYNAATAITGVVRNASSKKMYQELGLEFLKTIVYFSRYLKNNHHRIYLVKFHVNPQTTVLAETVTVIKFLFSLLKTMLKFLFSIQL